MTETAAAQQILDAHPETPDTGWCPTCGILGPCPPRRAALRIIEATPQLPRRRPADADA